MSGAAANRYGVEIRDDDDGRWSVDIVDPSGAAVATRACRSAAEARLFASTVRQHVYWLSVDAFRASYRLPES